MSYGVTSDLQVRRVDQLLSSGLSLAAQSAGGRLLHNTVPDLSFDLLVSPVSLITFPSRGIQGGVVNARRLSRVHE